MQRREWLRKLARLPAMAFFIGAAADGIAEEVRGETQRPPGDLQVPETYLEERLQVLYLAARQDAERLRVQLAGCGTAALGWSGECAPGSYGWSPAFEDTVILRRKFEAAVRLLADRLPAGQEIALYPCGCSAVANTCGLPHYCGSHGEKEYASRSHLIGHNWTCSEIGAELKGVF